MKIQGRIEIIIFIEQVAKEVNIIIERFWSVSKNQYFCLKTIQFFVGMFFFSTTLRMYAKHGDLTYVELRSLKAIQAISLAEKQMQEFLIHNCMQVKPFTCFTITQMSVIFPQHRV